MNKPPAEIELSVADVRELLRDQHPQFANLPILAGPSGWDNAMFRLGEELAVRLPRRESAAVLLQHEQRWLPQLAPQLPVSIPAPIRIGSPSESFPWHWSVTPWFDGETLDRAPLAADQAEVLASFLQSLHTPAPADAPHNPWRSVPLAQRQPRFEQCVEDFSSRGGTLDAKLHRIWEQAVQSPIDMAPTWIHGDLHARNVLVRNGRLSAVIDWGDMAQGDRAADLAATWMLLPQAQERERVMSACHGVSMQTWTRARGWALMYALVVLRSGDPEHWEPGQATLQRLSEGP
jgi:aminoglycoside phosphotransferase (APT) family kinase protein